MNLQMNSGLHFVFVGLFVAKKRANTVFTGCRQGRWGPTLPRLVPGWICKSWEICASPPPPLSPDLLEWISTRTTVYLWKNPCIVYIGHATTSFSFCIRLALSLNPKSFGWGWFFLQHDWFAPTHKNSRWIYTVYYTARRVHTSQKIVLL